MRRSRRSLLSMAGLAALLPAFARMAAAQTYPTRPVRFLVGDQDFLFEEDMIHAAAAHTDAEYRGDVLRGVGHFIPDEAKDQLCEIVLGYLGAPALTEAT